MPWVRIDDGFYDHEKFDELPDIATALWVKSLAWANRNLTDGAIRPSALRQLGYTATAAAKLVAAGLWERTESGWKIHNFAQYQPSAVEVEGQREERRQQKVEAGRKGGIMKAANKRKAEAWQTPSTPLADAYQSASENGSERSSEHLAPARPVPNPALPVITSLPPLLTGGVPDPVENRGGRVDKALEIITIRERDLAGAQIRHPAAWIRTVIEQNRIHHGARLHKLAHEHPEWSPEQLADTINPPAPVLVERPLCEKCHRHTTGLVECPNARDDCPTLFVLQVLA